MGLDMNPIGRPIKGKEKRFEYLFEVLYRDKKQSITWIDKVRGKKPLPLNDLYEEFLSLQISSYEIIKAPMVGRDQIANEWLKKRYAQLGLDISFEEFLENHRGYYVIELVSEEYALPEYVSMSQDANVFRGQFLRDCEDLIGVDIVSEAWESKFADEALDYGNRLLSIADKIANENSLTHIRDSRIAMICDEDTSLEHKLHVIYGVAKWLIFYGQRGCGYIANY